MGPGACAICGGAPVVTCPDCNTVVCGRHNSHPITRVRWRAERATCPGVTNPARRAILLGRCPDTRDAAEATYELVHFTGEDRTASQIPPAPSIAEGNLEWRSARTLGALYRALLRSSAAMHRCTTVVDRWIRGIPAPPDLPADLGRKFLYIDMSRSTWTGAMLGLCSYRAHVNALHRTSGNAVWALSLLGFDDHSIFVVNHKTRDGTGTTRMVWPIGLADDPHDLRDHQLRVLDVTYSEMAEIMLGPVLTAYRGDDARCAEEMIGVATGQASARAKMRSIQVRIGAKRCSFLRGVRFTGGALFCAPHWWLTRKSESAADLDAHGFAPPLYEVVTNILSILVLAEPRHARSMLGSTMRQLALVASGVLRFRDLFGRLGGEIAHGRLLPGANVLGPPLRDHRDLKALAMPLADLREGWMAATADAEHASAPHVQPLAKVLFTAALVEIALDLGWRPQGVDADDGAYAALDRGEVDEHDADLAAES